MSDNSGIEWTDATWNPARGCTKVSPGCKHCYAETFSERWRGVKGHPFEQGFDLRLVPEKLDQPLKWKKARRIFVNSMSDLFHEDVSNEYIAAVFGVMAATPKHTFQVLTKRPERAAAWFAWMGEHDDPQARMHIALAPLLSSLEPESYSQGEEPPIVVVHEEACERLLETDWPLPNVWLGVSVESQEYADARIPVLLEIPAAVRFLSVEPQLGPVDLTRLTIVKPRLPNGPGVYLNALTGHLAGPDDVLPAHVDWVIVGGESGPGARPFDIAWARNIVAQCKAGDVPVFVKQIGTKPETSRIIDDVFGEPFVSRSRVLVRHRKGNDMAEWTEDLRVRQFPVTP